MSLEAILAELEQLGSSNDRAQTDKAKKYLNITRDTAQFLSLLVKAVKAKTVLEVGTSNGYSTLWLSAAVTETDGHVYTVERNPSKAREARSNFERAGLLPNISLLVDDVSQALDRVPGPVDFIFLDADRSAYAGMAPRLFDMLKAGGVLVCDNAVSHPSELAEFTAWVQSQSYLSTSLVPVGKGELLVYKRGS